MTKIIGATIAIAVSVIGHGASPQADLCGCNSSCTYDRRVHSRGCSSRGLRVPARCHCHPDRRRGNDGCCEAHFQQEQLIGNTAPYPGLWDAHEPSMSC